MLAEPLRLALNTACIRQSSLVYRRLLYCSVDDSQVSDRGAKRSVTRPTMNPE